MASSSCVLAIKTAGRTWRQGGWRRQYPRERWGAFDNSTAHVAKIRRVLAHARPAPHPPCGLLGAHHSHGLNGFLLLLPSGKKNYFGTEGTCQIVVGRPQKIRLCGPPLHHFWCFRAPTTLWGPSEACGCAQSCSPSHKGAIRGCFWGSGVNSGVNLGVPG